MADFQTENVVFRVSATEASPGASVDRTVFYTNKPITIQEMQGVLVGGTTPSVTWRVFHGTDRSAAGTAVHAAEVTTSETTGDLVSTFTDATIPEDSWVWLTTSASSGSPDELTVTIAFKED